jgi:opacity protein-like surface antigen
MKIKVFLAGLAVAALAASSAVAAPPAGKGKPRTGEGCQPQVAVVLKGKLTSASTGSLTMSVTGANRWGRAWKTAGTATATLNDKTKVRGGGMKTVADLVADLKAGDRVMVKARRCKDDLKDPVTNLALTATMVVGHPAKAEEEND